MTTLSIEKTAYDYMEMFRGLLADFPVGESGNAMDAATGLSTLKVAIDREIAWAKQNLKRQDRIVWWLRWFRLWKYFQLQWAPQLFKKYDRLIAQEVVRTGVDKEAAYQSAKALHNAQVDFTHYLSLPIPAIQNLVWDRQLSWEIVDFCRSEEERWKAETRGLISPQPGDKPIIKFGDGWAWWMLDRGYCKEEAEAMGHCGNVNGQYHPSERILSLRRPVESKGREMWEPHLTFILDIENSSLEEMKGRGNERPTAKYHPYIVALLESDLVKRVWGGGYLPSHNFSLSDLPPEVQDKLVKKKPALANFRTRLRLEGTTPDLVSDIEKKLGLPFNVWKPELGGFINETWGNVIHFVKDFGDKDTVSYIPKVEGSYDKWYPRFKDENMLEVLEACTPDNLEMVFKCFSLRYPLTIKTLKNARDIVRFIVNTDLEGERVRLLRCWATGKTFGAMGHMANLFSREVDSNLIGKKTHIGTVLQWGAMPGTRVLQGVKTSMSTKPLYEILPVEDSFA